MSTIALTIPDFPRKWNYGRRQRNLKSEKNTPRPTMVMMNSARKWKECCFGNSMKVWKMNKFSPLNVKSDDEASEFEELVACGIVATLRVWLGGPRKCAVRIAEDSKWRCAERAFVALKKRCDEQMGSKKCKCILMVKTKEDGSSLVNRVVGTLELRINRYYSPPGVHTEVVEAANYELCSGEPLLLCFEASSTSLISS
ncbi:hypothetical protein C2S52_013674 [Perilla frutescens var. hirtella]|nr:hypothetical protein C2S52_013674 [Perilla frutescens var. hirtella]